MFYRSCIIVRVASTLVDPCTALNVIPDHIPVSLTSTVGIEIYGSLSHAANLCQVANSYTEMAVNSQTLDEYISRSLRYSFNNLQYYTRKRLATDSSIALIGTSDWCLNICGAAPTTAAAYPDEYAHGPPFFPVRFRPILPILSHFAATGALVSEDVKLSVTNF